MTEAKQIKNNVLNELDTHEWMKRLHSIQSYDWQVPKELAPHLQQGAFKPPHLIADIIRFFTKPYAQIFDPFAGEAGILVGAAIAGRLAAGCDLYPENLKTAAKVGEHYGFPMGKGWWGMQCVDALDWVRWLCEGRDGMMVGTQDLMFTDPPWGISHGRGPQDKGGSVPFNMVGTDEKDIGTFDTYEKFYEYIGQVAHYTEKLLKPGAYALWWFGDRHKGGQYRVVGAEAQPRIEAHGLRLKGVQHYSPKKPNVRRQVFGWGKAFVPVVDHASLWVYRKES